MLECALIEVQMSKKRTYKKWIVEYKDVCGTIWSSETVKKPFAKPYICQ